MIKPVFFCAVIIFTTAKFAASDRISIVTSPDNPCPGEHNGLFCLMLQQFVSSEIISEETNYNHSGWKPHVGTKISI